MGDILLSRWVTHFLVYLKRCRPEKEKTSIQKCVLRNAKNVEKKKAKSIALDMEEKKKHHKTLHLFGIIKTK